MKTKSLIIIAASFGLVGAVHAQEEKKGPHKLPPEVIAKFDKDGDGKLNDEEREAAKAGREEMMEARKKEMLEKFDKDGDGELNEEELAAAKASQGGKKVGKKRAEVIAKYDKDGDGKLNGEEQAAVRADKKQKLVEQFDEDKDGKLNEEEKAKMNELIQKRHDSHKKPAEAKGGGAPKEGAEPEAKE